MTKLIISGALLLFSVTLSGKDIVDEDGTFSRRNNAIRTAEYTSAIEIFISESIVKEQNRSEIPSARIYYQHDLDEDGLMDLLLVTSFSGQDGGNYSDSTLLAYLTSSGTSIHSLQLGGRGSRVAEGFITDSGAGTHLFIIFSAWFQTDALCCPTLTVTEELVFESNSLKLRSLLK
jgi:hypothetical protein